MRDLKAEKKKTKDNGTVSVTTRYFPRIFPQPSSLPCLVSSPSESLAQ